MRKSIFEFFVNIIALRTSVLSKSPVFRPADLVCSPDLVLGVQHDCVQSLVYLILFHHL